MPSYGQKTGIQKEHQWLSIVGATGYVSTLNGISSEYLLNIHFVQTRIYNDVWVCWTNSCICSSKIFYKISHCSTAFPVWYLEQVKMFKNCSIRRLKTIFKTYEILLLILTTSVLQHACLNFVLAKWFLWRNFSIWTTFSLIFLITTIDLNYELNIQRLSF